MTGKLLPTGKVREEVKFPKLGTLEVSMVDAANPFVFVRARDLGLKGNENMDEFGNNEATLKKCERFVQWSRKLWGLLREKKQQRKARGYQRSPWWSHLRPIQLQRVRWKVHRSMSWRE